MKTMSSKAAAVLAAAVLSSAAHGAGLEEIKDLGGTRFSEIIHGGSIGVRRGWPAFQPQVGAPGEIARSGFFPRAIYGKDDRKDLYEVKDPLQKDLARSAASLFLITHVEITPDGRWAHLETRSYGEGASRILTEDDLCPGEKFWNQREGSRCSGVLVGPDLLATAGHCVETELECGNTRFVFGFALQGRGDVPEVVPAEDVYGCAELVASHPNFKPEQLPDWALVRLDRPVQDRRPAVLNRSGVIEEGTPLFVVGNPNNLPLKVADNARVRKDLGELFMADLDTYHGNSGSPVFNAQTGVLEGLLVRGEEDFEKVERGGRECYISKVFPQDGGEGESVSKASVFADLVPDKPTVNRPPTR